MRKKIAAQEENALQVDASAVPVIGLGIVLSGVPDLLARSTTLALALFIAALLFLHRALIHFWSRPSTH